MIAVSESAHTAWARRLLPGRARQALRGVALSVADLHVNLVGLARTWQQGGANGTARAAPLSFKFSVHDDPTSDWDAELSDRDGDPGSGADTAESGPASEVERVRRLLAAWGVPELEADALRLLGGRGRSPMFSAGRVPRRGRRRGAPPRVPLGADTEQPGVLEALAKSLHWKRELILVAIDFDRSHQALNLVRNLALLGFGHVLILVREQPRTGDEPRGAGLCELLAAIHAAGRAGSAGVAAAGTGGAGNSSAVVGSDQDYILELTCVTSSYLNNHAGLDKWKLRGGAFHLWLIRYHTVARLMALGYHVMMLDSDFSIRTDPYAFLYAPPFVQHHLCVFLEGGFSINGGFLYTGRDTAPDGPAAWVIAEISRRAERWMSLEQLPVTPDGNTHAGGLLMDQEVFRDAALSAFAGLSIFRSAGGDYVPAKERSAWFDKGYLGAVPQSVVDWRRTAPVAPSPVHLPPCEGCLKWAKPVPLDIHNLTIPIDADDPVVWASPRGALGTGPGGGPWRPPAAAAPAAANSSSDVAAVAKTRAPPKAPGRGPQTESMISVPHWLVAAYGVHEHEAGGWLSAVPTQVVMAHFVGCPGKQFMFRALGWWYLSAADLAEKPLLARSATDRSRPLEPLLTPATRLLALAPDERLVTSSLEDARREIHRLGVAAILAGRRVVFPPLPCDAPWLRVSTDPLHFFNQNGSAGGGRTPRGPQSSAAGHIVITGEPKAPLCSVGFDACGIDQALMIMAVDLARWLRAHPQLAPAATGAQPLELASGGTIAQLRAQLATRSSETVLYVRNLAAVPLLVATKVAAEPDLSTLEARKSATEAAAAGAAGQGAAPAAAGAAAAAAAAAPPPPPATVARAPEDLSPEELQRLADFDRCRLVRGYRGN